MPGAEGDDQELPVAERRLITQERCSLLRSVLGSAIALRNLTLDLSGQSRQWMYKASYNLHLSS